MLKNKNLFRVIAMTALLAGLGVYACTDDSTIVSGQGDDEQTGNNPGDPGTDSDDPGKNPNDPGKNPNDPGKDPNDPGTGDDPDEDEPLDDSPEGIAKRTDSDHDGISDYYEDLEFIKGRSTEHRDTDGDTIPDYLDDDSDDDGISDSIESGNNGQLNKRPIDSDGDLIEDFRDTDSDNNGILDKDEVGFDASGVPRDTDGDTIPDFSDLDNDGDGLKDADEILGFRVKDLPEGVFAGDCNHDGEYDVLGSVESPIDCDGDGTPDYMSSDNDGDTIPDSVEGTMRIGKFLAVYSTDADGDGIPDNVECTLDADGKYTDTDGDDTYDCYDLDADNDGLSDAFENNCCTITDANAAECKAVQNWCSDPYLADSDGDGDNDLIEYGAETDPNDKDSNHLTKGNFVFTSPYQEPTTPDKESLAFEASIQTIDIFFNIDQSSSTADEAKKMNAKLKGIMDNLQCEDLKKSCVENRECAGLKNAKGEAVDAICSEKGRCIVNPKAGDGCFDSMEVGMGYYNTMDSFWVAVPVNADVTQTVTALERYYPRGDREVAFQAPICAALGIKDGYCGTNTSYWSQTNDCKPASDHCKDQTYSVVTGKSSKSIDDCNLNCKRNCVDLDANPDRMTCVGYRKSAIHIYAQIFDEEQCRWNSSISDYTKLCVRYFEEVGKIMKENKMRWMGLQSSSSSEYCTVSPASGSSSTKCIDGLCETVCTSSNKLSMSAVSDYISKQSGSIKRDGTYFTYKATGDDIDVQFEAGVREIAKSMPMDVTATVEDLDKDNVGASKLVAGLKVHLEGGKAQGENCFTLPANKIIAGDYEGISQLAPIDIADGYSICYDVVPVQNQDVFEPTSMPQVKKARIKVMGDGSVLNSGIAYFLIPPKIEVGTVVY